MYTFSVEKWLVETDFRWARRVILWHSGQIWKVACREQCMRNFWKSWTFSGLTTSFLTEKIHQTTYVWLGLCKTSARSIGGGKSLDMHKVYHGATVVRENHEICWKLAAPGSKWCSKSQIRFADANRPHRNSEVTRRDGFPLSSKSNTMAQRANLKGRLPWTMWAEFLENMKMLRIDQFVLDKNNFPSNNICMARFMQNLSSIHRRRKKFELGQGPPWCNRGTWKSWNFMKTRRSWLEMVFKIANSLRWRESPPHTQEFRSDS